MLKWIALRYIEKACQNRTNANYEDFDEIIKTIVESARIYEPESNDSTVYAYLMTDIRTLALSSLSYVSQSLKEIKF